MIDAVSIALRCAAIADATVRLVLETMHREEWPGEFRAILLGAIARRFQEEADKAQPTASKK